jgi:hypothetical protein
VGRETKMRLLYLISLIFLHSLSLNFTIKVAKARANIGYIGGNEMGMIKEGTNLIDLHV